MSFDVELGPISYVVVAFESAPVPTGGLDRVLGLVEAGRIIVLDVEFVKKDVDGSVTAVSATEVGVEAFGGASAQLIDADDIELVADSLVPGGVGVVLFYEDLTLLPALQAWTAEGATVVSEGPIILDDLVEAIDASEQS
jgi:hypothetical protein